MPRNLLSMSLVLLVLAVAPGAFAATAQVTTSGVTFVPDTVTVSVGDTVQWTWVGPAGHTVTSGTGAADPNVGALFDAPLNSLNTTFIYVFSDTAGIYPYFCRPHELIGMKGTVIVEANVSVPAPSAGVSWSRIKEIFR